ncbi:MAG: hypothetical protein U0797_00735 [Gemmataceae bacterium]
MHARTRNALLALGFDTDLIAAIDRNKHTVDALRALPKPALEQTYSKDQVALIQDKIVRRPIPEDVVARVLSAAGEACCYCEDGLTVRPYQIHHIEPYAASQDHSEENLLVVCPNHHAVIHENRTPRSGQKHARRKWHALVALADRYRAEQVSFPFGSFAAIDYVGEPSAAELVREIRVTAPTALDVSQHPLAIEVRDLVIRDRFALLFGRSGDGKTTVAVGVAGLLSRDGWLVFRYRPPSGDNRRAVREILEFIAVAARESVVILDDVNTWLQAADLEDVAAAVSGKASVIATWTREKGGDDTRLELHLPRWVSTDWERISPSVTSFLCTHEAEVVPVLRELEDPNSINKIGFGMFEENLASRMSRFEKQARTVSEFMFLLRGGAAIVRRELQALVEWDRADMPILYAAVEQIADFERAVSTDEAVTALRQLGGDPQLPAPTAEWVRKVFEHERERRRVQKRRDAYTTVHRDWAKRLICTALGNVGAREGITRILARDFDPRTERPVRTIRLWSWLWYDKEGTPFVRKWAESLSNSDWIAFVGTAANAGLEDVAFVADRLNLLFHSAQWDETVATAFSSHKRVLAEKVTGAGTQTWHSLRNLFTLISHVCPGVAADVVESWAPAKVVSVLEDTHPDNYDTVGWFFNAVWKHSSGWCLEVGRLLSWDRISESLNRLRPGDLDSVEQCHRILSRIGVPLLRSRLRRYVDCLASSLSNCSLSNLHPGIGSDLSFILRFYPEELDRLAAAIDPARMAGELSVASPNRWRTLLELSEIVPESCSDRYQSIVAALDTERFVAAVEKYGAPCPYELRCLLWLLTCGTSEKRAELAQRLIPTVREACRGCKTEHPRLVEAMTVLDSATGQRLSTEMPPPEEEQRKRERDDLDVELLMECERAINECEATGQDYDVGAIFEEHWTSKLKAKKDNADPLTTDPDRLP